MYPADIRARLFKRTLGILPVDDASLPEDLADLRGQLSVVELKGVDTSKAAKLATGSDGEIDELQANVALICQSLVLTETKERVFNDNDSEAVAAMGLSVIKPLSTLVQAVCGMNAEALAAAKKNSVTIPANASGTSLPANSEVLPAVS